MSESLPRGEREPLPHRRAGYNQKIRIGGTTFHLRTGEYPDGRVGEIFLDAAKAGSVLRAFMSSFAIAVSIGLQHGTPLSEYINAFQDYTFLPSGAVQGDPRFSEVASILDYVVRELGHTYLGRHDLLADTPTTSGTVL